VSNKDVKQIIALIRSVDGWEVRQTKKNYYLVHGPDGSRVVRIPSTPSGRAFYQRTRAALIKNGFPWPH